VKSQSGADRNRGVKPDSSSEGEVAHMFRGVTLTQMMIDKDSETEKDDSMQEIKIRMRSGGEELEQKG